MERWRWGENRLPGCLVGSWGRYKPNFLSRLRLRSGFPRLENGIGSGLFSRLLTGKAQARTMEMAFHYSGSLFVMAVQFRGASSKVTTVLTLRGETRKVRQPKYKIIVSHKHPSAACCYLLLLTPPAPFPLFFLSRLSQGPGRWSS